MDFRKECHLCGVIVTYFNDVCQKNLPNIVLQELCA